MISHKHKISFHEIIRIMIKDKRVRLSIVKRSHKFFFYFYFPHYAESPIAPFHEEMLSFTEDSKLRTVVIAGFRGCGKSVLLGMSFPLWAILGGQKIKYILILSQTEAKAQMMLQQIKYELEANEWLKKDLGPFREERGPWNTASICLDRYNAKITAGSTEQSIRSFRHMQYRPQLIIADDLEDLESVKTIDGRDKLYGWLIGDVIPAGAKNTRLIVIGGILHEDSLLRRLGKNINEEKMTGVYREYPFLNKDGSAAWPERFKTAEDIASEKKKIGDEIAWQREYLLAIVSDRRRVVHSEWLQYYESLPSDDYYLETFVGVDLAISEKDSADRTAMVVIKIYQFDDDRCVAYVMPFPFNKNISFPEQVNQIKALARIYPEAKIFVEKVAYQEALVQQCQSLGIEVEGVTPHGEKRERVALTSAAIKEGLILFPEKGVKELILQLTGFGLEKHDDLADAFSLVATRFIIRANEPVPGIEWIDFD